MNDREGCPDHERKYGYGFGAPGYRAPPLGSSNSQNCRDQGPGVGNPDPENEIRYIESPIYRAIDACDADPDVSLIKKSCASRQHHRAGYHNRKVPTLTGAKHRPE